MMPSSEKVKSQKRINKTSKKALPTKSRKGFLVFVIFDIIKFMDASKLPFNKDLTYLGLTTYRDKNQLFGIKRKDRRLYV